MMMNSYIKIALRNLRSQKVYSSINIVGLAAGICCFLLIMLFVRQELSYDRHYASADRIYRVSLDIHPPEGATIAMAANAPQVAPLLQQEHAEIEEAVRLVDWQTWLRSGTGELPVYQRAALVDENFFRVFDFQWLAGDPVGALDDTASVVLTKSAARRLFGTDAVVGRNIELEGGRTAQISGVIADLPVNTHLAFDLLLPMSWVTSLYGPGVFDNWSAQLFHTYVLLPAGTAMAPLAAQFPDFIERHVGEGESRIYSYDATPITDSHLHSTRRNELKPPGSLASVMAFVAIAVVVLLVAGINFMNLGTVRAMQRAREVGVRKAIGASKRQVVVQFLGEALMLVTFSLLLGVMAVELALPFFNNLVQQQLDLELLANLWILPVLILLVGLISGSYPAFYLASFNASRVLRGQTSGGRKGQWFSKLLVVLQFSSAVALLIATWVIYAQLDFVRNLDPGYEREQVVVLSNMGPEGVGRDWDLLKQQLLANPDILAVTASNTVPTSPVGSVYYFEYEGGSTARGMPAMLVDFDYFETYGIPPLAGRTFSREYGADIRRTPPQNAGESGGTFILNEMAARQLGWTPEEALGKRVGLACCGMEEGIVAGVVGSIHYGSIQQPLGPVIYAIPPEPVGRIHSETRLGLQLASIKLSGQNMEDTLAYIDQVWKQLRPEQAVSRYFLNDEFAGLYQNEELQGRLLAAFAILAIVITCMGLYGLSSYNALLRTKEIGVRKVMGGSVWSIVLLLTNDFSKLVLISNLVAWPVAYFAMERWLQNFAYRIDLSPLVFIGSGLIALCIAWVTVGGTAAKAASAKPVLALRYE